MDERQFSYLQEMGISLWVSREDCERDSHESLQEVPVSADSPPAQQPEILLDSGPQVEAPLASLEPDHAANQETEDETPLDWAGLQEMVSRCQRCSGLASQRLQTLFGEGNPQADWLIVADAPDAEEERLGKHFVGPAGQLLDAMLHAIGLKRSQVYIANILKCHPSDNRAPMAEEIEACSGYLQRQIELIRPRVVLVLGKVAAQTLLKSDAPVEQLRGHAHQLILPNSPELKIPLVVSHHPAYLLEVPAEKAQAWRDLKLARSLCD